MELLNILLVEDTESDVLITKRALEKGEIKHKLIVAEDGADALAYLRKQEPFTAAVRPDVILLDLNLPKMNGLDVLAEIKADDAIKNIPVVIMTMSDSDQDRIQSYQHHVNGFLRKPIDAKQFCAIVQRLDIDDFFLPKYE